jgi:hypothetical protein
MLGLTPLQTFKALDTRPAYKTEIQQQVEAIRKPIKTFINDKDVEEFQKNLVSSMRVDLGMFRMRRAS